MKLLALASYCGDDNEDCSDAYPCRECLDMCNIFEINMSDTKYKYIGELQNFKLDVGEKK